MARRAIEGAFQFRLRFQVASYLRSHGGVAFLPSVPVRLKCLKPKEPESEPETLGEHLKRARRYRQLTQKEAAQRLGVNAATILNWEKARTRTPVEVTPAVLAFLGYDPFPAPKTLPERLLAKRRTMGWSIREAARQLGIEPSTWADWEHGKTILFRKHRTLVAQLLGMLVDEVDQEMGTRWVRSHGEEMKVDRP